MDDGVITKNDKGFGSYFGGFFSVRLKFVSAPLKCPREVRDLMLECWQREEAERPSFREIHLFLQRKNLGYDPR